MPARKRTPSGPVRRKQDAVKKPEPWYRRGPKWLSVAVIAPVAVLVISAALIKFVGLDQASSSADGNQTTRAAAGKTPFPNSGKPVLVSSAAYEQSAAQGATLAFPGILSRAKIAQYAEFRGSFQNYIANASSAGGTGSDDAEVQIALRGNSRQTAVITGIQVIKKCEPPLSGTLLYSPAAAEDTNIEIGFNLDSQFSVPQDYKAGQLYGSFFSEHTISLRNGETQTLLMHAVTHRKYCQFSFRLIIDTANRRYVEAVSNSGKPFSVTGTAQPLTPGSIPFSNYRAIYVAGVASPQPGKLEQVNPASYDGS
jgi:hypothetical protein